MSEMEHLKVVARKYFDVLHGTLKGLNLTSFDNFDDFFRKQMIDSVLPLNHASLFKKLIENPKIPVFDIGFGGGFPLIPLAAMYPEKKFYGFEARHKKVEAVKYLTKEVGVKNVSVFHQRLEEVVIDCEVMLLFKAVGTCEKIFKTVHVNSGVPIWIYFYKGPHVREKEIFLEEQWKQQGWILQEEQYYHLSEDEGRSILGFSRHVSSGKNDNSKKSLEDRSHKKLIRLSCFL